ncbi:MAG: carbon monoxide dehydrogenase [Acidimicrobiales bacterium mtb01]|nr:xanthine dehydrogenase family protein molybdopterin-binding subunit [Actinomycetota bacterium]TEX45910.1 MAG: carbon monoxide dehydrogenase [Acidimicrobiales bacterium mtb01]
MSLVGAKVLRKEDPRLLSGTGTYVDDLSPAQCAFASFVTSAEAHATIDAIDVRAALAIPGVLAVYTAADFTDYPDLPGGLPTLERPALARNTVRFVGEPVAVVVAEDRYIAADAVAAVTVSYSPLKVMTTIEDATAGDSVPLFPRHGSNVITIVPTMDDLEKELAKCHGRASLHIVNQRCAAVPIEPMAVLADWKPDGLTVWATFQAPHHLRNYLATWLDIPQMNCRVVAPDVGGGFGSKIVWYPELFIAPVISKLLRRPVKFAQTRTEAMMQMAHGRDQVHDIEVGYEKDGTIKALRLIVSQNLGAYGDPTGLGLAVLTTWMAAGAYRIPKVSTSFRTVVTNTTPVAAYRGAGRPEAAYSIERIVDQVARQTGLDPAVVRQRNFIPPSAFPYETHNEAVVYDSADFPAALAECLRIVDYDAVRAEQKARRNDPSKPLLGIGLSCWLEIAGFGPNGSLEGFGHLASWESAQVRIQPDGSAIVYSGSSPHGQGHETMLSQIASDELGISFDRIKVITGDTAAVLQGIGTMGSRGAPTAGSAVKVASSRVLTRAKRIAAHLLEAAEEDLEVVDDAFNVKGSPGKKVSWGDVAWASFQPLRIPPELQAGSLEERLFQESPNFSYPSGAYACVVEIDRETGDVTIRDMVLVDDCGTVINPLLAEGQVHGGVAQGIAQALYEGVSYDSSTGQPVTANLLDYLVPSAADLPDYKVGRTTTLCPNNPLGAKGIGESGSVGAPPAVINAIVDALSEFGVDHIDMPATPEKIWKAMKSGGNS